MTAIPGLSNIRLTTPSFDFGSVELLGERYMDGTLALLAQSQDDLEPPEPLSVNLSAYGFVPEPNCVFIKDYSEHLGLPDALEQAGVATKVREVPIGFSKGWEMRLTAPVEELVPRFHQD